MSKAKNNLFAAFDQQHVTVTGGLGFIGSNLVLRLVDAGARVQIIDALLPEYGGSINNLGDYAPRVTIHKFDLRQTQGLDALLKNQKFIFSLAGQVSHIDSMHFPQKDLHINTETSVNLLQAIRVSCPDAMVVYSGTRQVYGKPTYLPVDERHSIVPVDVNGINKLMAEHYYQLYQKVYGIKSSILRLTNTYGPRMDLASLTKGFVGIFVKKALSKSEISIFGDGLQRRDFNHVDDVCTALMLAAVSPKACGEIFNLGHHHNCSLLEFTELLTEMTGSTYKLVPFPKEQQAIDIGDYYGSYAKFESATGWRPEIELDAGLKETIAYFRRNR